MLTVGGEVDIAAVVGVEFIKTLLNVARRVLPAGVRVFNVEPPVEVQQHLPLIGAGDSARLITGAIDRKCVDRL